MRRLNIRPKNLVLECAKKAFENIERDDIAIKCQDVCASNFTIFHVLNYIMYTEARSAFDMIVEEGLLRQGVKKSRLMCENEWARYQDKMRAGMNDQQWYLIQDYVMAAHNDAEEEIEAMYGAFKTFLDSKGVRLSDMYARLAVALKIGDLIITLWPRYFAQYKRVCGFDFSCDYTYANMTVFIHGLRVMLMHLPVKNISVDFAEDEASVIAMANLEKKLADEDYLDNAAMEALNYNPKCKEDYLARKRELEEKERKES